MKRRRLQHGFLDFRSDKQRQQDDARHQEAMANRPRGWVRGMDEFSADELRELNAKLQRWVRDGVAAVMSM